MKSEWDFNINMRVEDRYHKPACPDSDHRINMSDLASLKKGIVPSVLVSKLTNMALQYEEVLKKEREQYDLDSQRTLNLMADGLKLFALYSYINKKPLRPREIILAKDVDEANAVVGALRWWGGYSESYGHLMEEWKGDIPKGKVLVASEVLLKYRDRY